MTTVLAVTAEAPPAQLPGALPTDLPGALRTKRRIPPRLMLDVAAVFVASIGGVVGLTRWMPSSPLSSALADDHGDKREGGPGEGKPGRQGQQRREGGRRNGNAADLSFGAVPETASTIVPLAVVVGGFAIAGERSRKRRNTQRNQKISGAL
jgi:hypothetical protein